MRIFGTINKVDEQEDGTLLVSGTASSPNQDSQKETITADAMKAAIPDYMKFANVREMHDAKKAAGVATELSVNDEGYTEMTALVVDPIAITKVRTGVYKGFSVAGKVTSRDKVNKSIITGLQLFEISLVDRPANPEAVFTCFKADGITEDEEPGEEEEIAKGGEGEEEVTEQPTVVEDVIVKAMIDGVEVSLLKKADGTYASVEDDLIAKGAYSIERLAGLAEGLEYFANSRSYDLGTGSPSTIPEAARKLAVQLYDLLIVCVSEDVTAAKERIKAAGTKKGLENEDLQKSLSLFEGVEYTAIENLVNFQKSLGGVELHVFEDDVLGKFVGSGEGIAGLKELIEGTADLTKKYTDLHAKWMASPAASPLEKAQAAKVISKSQDMNGEDAANEAPNDPVEVMKSVHATGGKRIYG